MEGKRQFSRIACDEIIIAKIGANAFIARIVDLSLRGALIRFADDVEISSGDICLIVFRLKDSGIFLKFTAEVLHMRNNLAGVKFVDVDLDTLTHLRSLLEARTADPCRICDELPLLAESGQ